MDKMSLWATWATMVTVVLEMATALVVSSSHYSEQLVVPRILRQAVMVAEPRAPVMDSQTQRGRFLGETGVAIAQIPE